MAALPKKIQGALALTSPTEEEAVDYNAQMSDLVGQLVETPEQRQKGSMLAWAGGLTDASGNGNLGGALIGGAKAQSDYNIKDRELKSQYIPLIMNALAQQQQNAALLKLQTAGANGEGGASSLIGMPIDRLVGWAQLYGVKPSDATAMWKAANTPDAMAANTVQRTPNKDGTFSERYIGDPKSGLNMNPADNGVSVAPGAAGALAHIAGSTELATQRARKGFEFSEGVAPDGTHYKVPLTQSNPEMFGNPPAGPAPVAPAGPVPQGPGPAPTGPASAPPRMSPPPGGMGAGTPGPAPAGPPGTQPNGNFRGAWTGTPAEVTSLIERIQDPQERANAAQSYQNQLQGSNPAYAGPGDGAVPPQAGAGQAPPMAVPTMPVANNVAPAPQASGVPAGAIQTSISPRRDIANKSLILGNESFMKNEYAPTLEAGDQATSQLATIAQSRTALKALGGTGWGEPAKETAVKVLATLGVPEAASKAANYEIFKASAATQLWKGLQAQKGPQTEQDAARMQATFAQITNREKANAFILDAAQAAAERDKMRADYFRKALPFGQESGDLAEIGRRWNARAPSVTTMPSMRRWNVQ